MSPYLEEVSANLRQVLQQNGVETPVFGTFGEAEESKVVRISGASVRSAARYLLAGGGLRSGQVVGQSSSDAGRPHTTPITIPNLVATVMQTLLDIGEIRTMTGIPNELSRVITGQEPIHQLMG